MGWLDSPIISIFNSGHEDWPCPCTYLIINNAAKLLLPLASCLVKTDRLVRGLF